MALQLKQTYFAMLFNVLFDITIKCNIYAITKHVLLKCNYIAFYL